MNREEANVRAVLELLRTARSYPKAMADLRRRLRDAENGLRLTEAGKSGLGAYPGARFRHGVQFPPPIYSWERMTEMYRQERARLDQRIELLREKRALLDRLLSVLTELEFQIIALKWIDGRSWQGVSMRAYVCERHGQRIQKCAIEKMAQKLTSEVEQIQSSMTGLTDTDSDMSVTRNFSRNP